MSRALLSFGLMLLLASVAQARGLRAFWIPQAVTPPKGDCRFELEDRFTTQRKATDRGGEFFEYGLGYGCHALEVEEYDVELGLDYIEANDIKSTNLLAPFQANARVVYGQREEQGWTAAFGVDALGFKAGQNNFAVYYLLGQHRAGAWTVALGGYSGNSRLLRSHSGKKARNGAMLGAWREIGRGRVGVEWQSGQNRFGYGVLGAEVVFDERITAGLAYAIANDRSLMRDWVLLRLQLR